MPETQTEAPVSRPPRTEWYCARWNLAWLEEYLPTIATEIAVLAAQIAAYKLAARNLGQTGFSEYAVARRTVSLIYPVTLLGLGVGLPRYIALSHGRGRPEDGERYATATLWMVGAAAAFCAILLNVLSGWTAFLFFGSRGYAPEVLPLSLMVFGLSLHSVVYSYFRGKLRMAPANRLELANLAAAPVVSFFLLGNSPRNVMLALGALWSAISAVALCFTRLFSAARRAGLDLKPEARELLRYGIQRLPGDFILMALLGVPVTLAAHRNGLQQAGYMAFAISALSMVGSLFSPLGLILLPKASALIARADLESLRAHVLRLAEFSAFMAALATLQVWLFAPALIGLYLGTGFESAAFALRAIILGAVPYALFVVLRNLIDAFHRNAVTALISGVGFAVFAIAAWLTSARLPAAWEIAGPLLLGLFVLGAAAGAETRRILCRVPQAKFVQPAALDPSGVPTA